MMDRYDVIILGAGLSGLAAAELLARAGLTTCLLERENYFGGLAATFRHDDYLFDLGPHRFHTRSKAMEQFVVGLLGDDVRYCQKRTALYFEKKYYHYPLSLRDVLTKSNKIMALAIALDFFKTKIDQRLFSREERSFADWVTGRYGSLLYRYFFKDYTEKVWGVDPAYLSADWAEQRIASKGLIDTLLNLVASPKKLEKVDSIHSPYNPSFIYSRLGIGHIAKRLVERIESGRGRLVLNSPVQRINKTKELYKVTAGDSNFTAGIILSTIPLDDLITALGFKKPPGLAYRGMILVYLYISDLVSLDYHWVYFQDNRFLFNRICDFAQFTPEMAPDGKSTLCFEITADPGDLNWNRSDNDLVKVIIEQYSTIAPRFADLVEGFSIRRIRTAYPVLSLGYREALQQYLRLLDSYKNLHTFGRNGLFKYVNMDHCLLMGQKTAEKCRDSLLR